MRPNCNSAWARPRSDSKPRSDQHLLVSGHTYVELLTHPRGNAEFPRHPQGRWLLPPQGGFAFVAGPAGMTIELFDEEICR